MFDTDEYIHLALDASKKGNSHSAMTYLKSALTNEPENPVALYLLAAEHAELGLFERAIEGMLTALALAPEMEIARFQLGLLYLQKEDTLNAAKHFELLKNSGDDASLKSFATAYCSLLSQDIGAAVASLQEGLAVCQNDALRADMSRVLAGLTQQEPALPATTQSAASALLLDAYRDTEKH